MFSGDDGERLKGVVLGLDECKWVVMGIAIMATLTRHQRTELLMQPSGHAVTMGGKLADQGSPDYTA